MTDEKTKSDRAGAFVGYAIKRVAEAPGFRAALRRAANPATEYYSWEYLAGWCDLEKEWDRLPFATIGAALAEAKPSADGVLSVGRAVAYAYSDGGRLDGSSQEAAKARLRRLLACKTVAEACQVLRPNLKLMASRGVGISYAGALRDLLYFNDRTVARWAEDFYGRREPE